MRGKEFIFDSEFFQKQYFSGKGRTSNDIFAELVIYTGRAMHEFWGHDGETRNIRNLFEATRWIHRKTWRVVSPPPQLTKIQTVPVKFSCLTAKWSENPFCVQNFRVTWARVSCCVIVTKTLTICTWFNSDGSIPILWGKFLSQNCWVVCTQKIWYSKL